jgi:hypothetical protein
MSFLFYLSPWLFYRPSTLTSTSATFKSCPVWGPVISDNVPTSLFTIHVGSFLGLGNSSKEHRQNHSVCTVTNNPTSRWHEALSLILAINALPQVFFNGSSASSNSLRVWIKSHGGLRNSVDQFYGWLKNKNITFNTENVPRRKINILRGHSIGHSKQKMYILKPISLCPNVTAKCPNKKFTK